MKTTPLTIRVTPDERAAIEQLGNSQPIPTSEAAVARAAMLIGLDVLTGKKESRPTQPSRLVKMKV